jgi:hypothetical protein
MTLPVSPFFAIARVIGFVGIVGVCYALVRRWRRTRTEADRRARALAITNAERPHR